MKYIAFDCHRRYTFGRVEDASGRVLWEGRIPHRRGIFLEFLEGFEPSTPVALETILHLKEGTRFHRITGG